MKRKRINIHLTKVAKGWQLDSPFFVGPGSFRTKAHALDWVENTLPAIGRVFRISLKVHLFCGKFQEERTYPRSTDPRRTKG